MNVCVCSCRGFKRLLSFCYMYNMYVCMYLASYIGAVVTSLKIRCKRNFLSDVLEVATL